MYVYLDVDESFHPLLEPSPTSPGLPFPSIHSSMLVSALLLVQLGVQHSTAQCPVEMKVAVGFAPVVKDANASTWVKNPLATLAGCCTLCAAEANSVCEAYYTGPRMKECVLYPPNSIIGIKPSPNHTSGFRGPVPAPVPPAPPAPAPGPGSFDQKLIVRSPPLTRTHAHRCTVHPILLLIRDTADPPNHASVLYALVRTPCRTSH